MPGASCTRSPRSPPRTATTSATPASLPAPAYSYRVRATDAAGNLGPYSNTINATTPTPDTTPPSRRGRWRRPQAAREVTWPGERPPTTSASPDIESSDARAPDARPSASSPPRPPRPTLIPAHRQHELQLPGRAAEPRKPRALHEHRQRDHAAPSEPCRGLRVWRGVGDDGRRHLRSRNTGTSRTPRGQRRQVRQRALVQRIECDGDDCRLGIASSDNGHDARGVGQSRR